MSKLKAFQTDTLTMKNTITNEALVVGGHGCGTASEYTKICTLGPGPYDSTIYGTDTFGDWNDEGCCGEE